MEYLNEFSLLIKQHSIFSYWLLLLISFTESLAFVGIIFPGTTFVVIAGFLASQGYLELKYLIPFVSVGAFLGDYISYWLGTKGTGFFTKSKFFKKDIFIKGEDFFKKHGGKSVFIGRFVGPIRPVIPFVAGFFKMDKLQFLFWNVTSAILWALSNVLFGYYSGGALKVMEELSSEADFIIIVLIVLFIVSRIVYKHLKKSDSNQL